MRLLHVYSGNLYGGIEAILVSLARYRVLCPGLEQEFAVCFDGRLSRELEALGAPVHRMGEVRVSRPHTMQRARRALANSSAFGASTASSATHPGRRALRRRCATAGVPLALWVHDATSGRHWTERWARRTRPIWPSATVSSPLDCCPRCTATFPWPWSTRLSRYHRRGCRRPSETGCARSSGRRAMPW